jgi:hypothetical protein
MALPSATQFRGDCAIRSYTQRLGSASVRLRRFAPPSASYVNPRLSLGVRHWWETPGCKTGHWWGQRRHAATSTVISRFILVLPRPMPLMGMAPALCGHCSCPYWAKVTLDRFISLTKRSLIWLANLVQFECRAASVLACQGPRRFLE